MPLGLALTAIYRHWTTPPPPTLLHLCTHSTGTMRMVSSSNSDNHRRSPCCPRRLQDPEKGPLGIGGQGASKQHQVVLTLHRSPLMNVGTNSEQMLQVTWASCISAYVCMACMFISANLSVKAPRRESWENVQCVHLACHWLPPQSYSGQSNLMKAIPVIGNFLSM